MAASTRRRPFCQLGRNQFPVVSMSLGNVHGDQKSNYSCQTSRRVQFPDVGGCTYSSRLCGVRDPTTVTRKICAANVGNAPDVTIDSALVRNNKESPAPKPGRGVCAVQSTVSWSNGVSKEIIAPCNGIVAREKHGLGGRVMEGKAPLPPQSDKANVDKARWKVGARLSAEGAQAAGELLGRNDCSHEEMTAAALRTQNLDFCNLCALHNAVRHEVLMSA